MDNRRREEVSGDDPELSRLSNVANEYAKRIGFWETDRFRWDEIFGDRHIHVALDEGELEERFRNRLPPVVQESRRYGEKIIFLRYNNESVEDFASELSHIQSVDRETANKIYIGMGVASYIVEKLVSPTNQGINDFYQRLSSPDKLIEKLDHLPIFKSDTADFGTEPGELSQEKADFMISMMHRTRDQTARVNILRFCLGMYLYVGEESSSSVSQLRPIDPIAIVEGFQEGLRASLDGKSAYLATIKALGVNDADEAERMWSESLSDIRIAGAIPMTPDEMIDLLKPIARY